MKRYRKWILRLLFIVLLAVESAPSWAEPRIGVAASTKPNADGITAGNSQTLGAGSEVFANETIRTGNLGQADLVFVDKTNLTVGPTSEVVLDKFVYDPNGSKGSVVFKATRGAFRFVTGTQDHRVYAVDTPSGSLGVRGTTVEVVTLPQGFCEAEKKKGRNPPGCECETKVRLIEGQATFTVPPKAHRENEEKKGENEEKKGENEVKKGEQGGAGGQQGRVARLTQPNQTVCISPTGAITYGSSSTSILGFQLASEEHAASPPPGASTPPPSGGAGIPGVPPITPPTCTTLSQPNCTP